MADDSFTRSLYIGRDKAIEVARRREAAEAELKARREERIRIQNERLQRAAQTKEQELKEKCRQKQERELQRQRAVLDRRSARLEQQKAKAEELLHRVQSSTARNSQGGGSNGNKTTKSTYVFGSSTPRELSYLERLSHEQKAYNSVMTESKISNGTHSSKERSVSNERSLVGAKGTPLRLPSRIAPQSATIITGKRPATVQPRSNYLMTRSVFGTLNSGGAKTRTLPVPAPRATPAGAKPTPSQTTHSKRGASPMTQSMYVAKTPTAANKDPAKQSTALGRLTAPTAASASRSSSKVSKSSAESNASENGAAVEPVRKPVIRPRKAVDSEKKPVMGAEKMEAKTDGITSSGDTNVAPAEHLAASPIAPAAIPPLMVGNIASVLSNVSEGANPLPMKEEERGSPESKRGELLIDILGEDSTPRETTPLVQQPALSSGSGPSSVMPIVDLGGGGERSSPNLSGLHPSPISNSSNSPVQGQHQVAAELDREREERRQRLNQILQRTRMDTAVAAAATVAQTNAIDASALAQDLLAQRRQQKLQQQQQAAMANGHSQNGMVHEAMNGSTPVPGQVLFSATNEENPLFEQNLHLHNQSEAVIAASDGTTVKDIGSLLSRLATADTSREHVEGSGEEHMDPEDPRTNVSAGREKNKLIIQ